MQELEKKRWILESLHHLIANNVIGGKQYDSRYKGFRGELSYLERCRSKGTRLHAGGYLLPAEVGAETTCHPVYFTITADNMDAVYERIYNRISRLDCAGLYFIQYDRDTDPSNWELKDIMGIGVPLPVPEFKTAVYDAKSKVFNPVTIETLRAHYEPAERPNKRRYPIEASLVRSHIAKLAGYHSDDLLGLYVQRLVFDGMIGWGRVRGIPSDIDGIFCEGAEPKYFIEIKEKDLSKREPKGFGMDLGRIESLTRISKLTGIPYYYIVREVDNQTARDFLRWLYIEMEKFAECVKDNEAIEGGTGMRSERSSNPTRVCPLEHFRVLS